MSTFETQITINNTTNSTFTLDSDRSSGIDSNWPDTLEPGGNYNFSQGWDFQIKFQAWYNLEGGNDQAIDLDYYADGVNVFDCDVKSDPDGIFTDSTCDSTSPGTVTFKIAGSA